ncbi:MAG: universal stress protein [Gammaproteobacteria bacterium]|nr:universal stress protein [Gammaproteobacteria bacterium]
MFEANKITVVVDPEVDNANVIAKAMLLAKVSRAQVELVYSEYVHYLEDGYFYDPVVAKTLREEHSAVNADKVAAMAQTLREAGLTVNIVALWGSPANRAILEHLSGSTPSLLIKSTAHHNRVARLFLANEDWELVRHAPAPLLLMKGLPWAEPPVFIAAVDPDHLRDKPESLDKKLITHALELKDRFNGEAHLYHYDWIPPLSGLYALQIDTAKESAKLADLGAAHGISSDHCHWTDALINDSLPALVEELDAAVVVMGAISRSTLDRVLVGSTAERLLDELACDVLVLKPD